MKVLTLRTFLTEFKLSNKSLQMKSLNGDSGFRNLTASELENFGRIAEKTSIQGRKAKRMLNQMHGVKSESQVN